MLENLSLRQRVFYLFAFIAVGAAVLLAAGLWFASDRLGPGSGAVLVLYGGGAGFAIVGLITWAWQKFDTNVVEPADAMARDLETVIHANPDHEIAKKSAGYLERFAAAARRMGETLKTAREEVAAEVALATRAADEQKARLEVILRDLHEGVLICNLNHQILLYNRRALEILHVSGELGLGRSLFSHR